MATIHKLKKNGSTIFPATITDAVVHPSTVSTLTSMIKEYNVSELFPTDGVDGGNTYTLPVAIQVLGSHLRAEEKTGGIKLAFTSNTNTGIVEEYVKVKPEWSTILTDWELQTGVGDIVGDPTGTAWQQGTAEAYVDQKISEQMNVILGQNTKIVLNSASIRQEAITRKNKDDELEALINAGIRDGEGLVFDTTPTSGSINPVTSNGIHEAILNDGSGYNVSYHHPTEGVSGGDTYTLAGAYSIIPNTVQRGGISIKFIDSETSKFVTYKLKTASWPATFDASDWQRVKDNDGVWDVSDNNRDLNNNPTTYNSLQEVLTNADTLIPSSIRKGGMSIKFIQSSDNKYVQYRYMGTAVTGNPNPFLDTTNWQGVDSEPVLGGKNLIDSGGVYEAIIDMAVVGDIVGDPTAKWEPGTAEAYIDQKIEELDARLDAQDALLDNLNGSEVIVVADHTQVTSPNTQKIYREQGTTSYTDWMYQNGAWKEIATYDFPGLDDEPTADSDNLVRSGGVQTELALGAVYDVSAKNPTAGPNNDGKFVSLSALLSDANINTLIPPTARKGGMSIKFIKGTVQSSDNKYVQYRLMADEWSDVVTNWQGVDDVPIENSPNLVKSGGVYEAIADKSNNLLVKDDDSDADLNIGDDDGNVIVQFNDGHIKTKNFDSRHIVASVNNNVSRFKGKNVIVFGDSISYGYNSTALWCQLLSDSIEANLINYAVSGYRVTEMTTKIAQAEDGEIVFFFGGTNDWGGAFQITLGTMYSSTDTNLVLNTDTSTFYGSVVDACKKLIAKYPNKEIYFITPIHRGTYKTQRSDIQKNNYGYYLYQYVDAIKEVCRYFSIPVIDLWASSGMNPNETASANAYFNHTDDGQPDLLHPDANGHKNIANIVLRFITTQNTYTKKQRGVIFDTDWWTDVDDAVAIRTLLWAERCEMIDLIGVCVDAVRETSIPSIAKFLNEEGRGGLVIACDKQATDYNGTPSYHQTVINNWTYSDGYNSNNDAEDCVDFYRRALSAQNEPIDIICVGYGNALSRLLDSSADEYSELSGVDLIREKVRKLWWMAGAYPSGSENNMTRTNRSRVAAYNICENWPTEIVFLGFEVGETVISGKNLNTYTDDNDLLYKVMYQLVGANGRSSWDPMTVLLAAFDNKDVAGYTYVQGTNSVNSSTGANTFTPDNSGKHFYVVKKHSNWWYEHQIDSIIRLNSWPSRKLGNKQLIKI